MNLIQIQEHLKDLPTQAIMSYANGQNPQVPPYMALGEMNRRKSMEQRAAQAPDSSVKEKLESELSQQVGLPGIGQGMNMRINPAGMPQPMPAAQPQMAPQMPKMPTPPMAQKMPPQQMAKPGSIPAGAPGMAAGGCLFAKTSLTTRPAVSWRLLMKAWFLRRYRMNPLHQVVQHQTHLLELMNCL